MTFRHLLGATVLLATTTVAGTAFANHRDADPEQRTERMVSQLEQRLAVDNTTAVRVAEVLQAHGEARRQAFHAARAEGERPSREEHQARRAEGEAALTEELAGILNADQIRHVLTMVDAHRARHMKRQREQHASN